MWLSALYLTFLFELCLLGLVKFPFEIRFLDTFLEMLFQRGGIWGQSKLVFPKWKEASYV
jgi:hypothetical protein